MSKRERRRIVIDFEVLSNAGFWMCCMKDYQTKKEHTIINDREEFLRVFNKNKESVWIGYNIKGYDIWIMKAIIAGVDPCMVSKKLIEDRVNGWNIDPSFNNINIIIFDLMTSNNKSLKELELYMGEDIRESKVSFDLEHFPTKDEIQELSSYCMHDVRMTFKVLEEQYHKFKVHMGVIDNFNLNPLYLSKTEAQLSSIVLEAKKPIEPRDDDMDFDLIDTIILSKYKNVLNWYLDKDTREKKKTLKCNVYGLDCDFGWGGMHSAIPKYEAEGYIVQSDANAFYSTIMIEYNLLSRNVKNPRKFVEISDNRSKLKKEKDDSEKSFKALLTATFGASKDEYNDLYDPRNGNAVCVNGQLLLLDFIEKVEEIFGSRAIFIQSNTDGIIFKFNTKEDLDEYLKFCDTWCSRTKIILEHDFIKKIIQKDVNNYILIYEDNSIKRVGSYVKELSILDNDLPIINKALFNKIVHNIEIEDTINNANSLIEFQKCVKLSGRNVYGLHGKEKINLKILRVFASNSTQDHSLVKIKDGVNQEKIPFISDRVFIDNSNVQNKEIPTTLDRAWYISLAKKRYSDFVKEETYDLFDYLNTL